MNDQDVIKQIGSLVDEEHALERDLGQDDANPDAANARLREIEVALDQCWDLLRQRRARRNAGEDPDGAAVRDERIVENYQQ